MKRLLLITLAAAMAIVTPTASAYYHFTRYLTNSSPYATVVDRFDLSNLPGGTVPYLISEAGPEKLAEGDSYAAVVSQIRGAAQVWGSVPTSNLRVAFGGLFVPDTAMNTPRIEVVFSGSYNGVELPPGVVAMGGPVVRGDIVTDSSGLQFTPILRSLLVLPRDLSARPSWSERFFLTLVHEFGHTLGLQHTWTGAAMSTEVTRSTSKASPLAADDRAGISILYPQKSFSATTGTISGRVTLNGAGVHLATVVALSPKGDAISTMTLPDGTYTLRGVAPGFQYIYAQPAPPSLPGEPLPVNLELPTDGLNTMQPGPAFDTVFYPGTATPQSTVQVSAGTPIEGIDFAVSRRDRANVHSFQNYSFLGREAIKPATFVIGNVQGTMVFTGMGLYSAAGAVPGLGMSVLNSPERVVNISPYSPSPIYYQQADFQLTPFSTEGPRHLILSLNNETHVQPSAVRLVQNSAPSLDAVAANPDRTVAVAGKQLSLATRFLFDGAPATIQSVTPEGVITLVPPVAPSGHRAVLTALNPDGQSSLMVHGAASPTYSYDPASAPVLGIQPSIFPAGAEFLVEVAGANTSFLPDPMRLGFGTSDVAVLAVYPTSATSALALVSVAGSANPGPLSLTAATGIQLATGPAIGQVQTGSLPVFVKASRLQPGSVYPGAVINVTIHNAPSVVTPSGMAVLFNEELGQVVAFQNGVATIQVPANLPVGPTRLRLWVNGQAAMPSVVWVSLAPPTLIGFQTALGSPITTTSPVKAGDSIQLLAFGMTDSATPLSNLQVKAYSGEVEHQVLQVSASTAQPGVTLITLTLSAQSPADKPLGVRISVDGRVSNELLIPIQ
jgi:hypothetical protein